MRYASRVALLAAFATLAAAALLVRSGHAGKRAIGQSSSAGSTRPERLSERRPQQRAAKPRAPGARQLALGESVQGSSGEALFPVATGIELALPPAPPSDPALALHMARLAQLDTAHKAEVRDDGWASYMEDGVASAFGSEDIRGSDLSLLTCARTLCAVRIDHENAAAAQAFAEHFDELAPDLGAGYVAHLGDEQTGYQTAMYLAREGSEAIDVAVRQVPDAPTHAAAPPLDDDAPN